MRSVYDAIKAMVSLRPIAASAASAGIGVDTKGFNSAMAIIENGAATGTPTSYTVDAKVQECDTNSGTAGDWADVTGATMTQITADAKSGIIRIEGLGTSRKRFLKVVVTPDITGGTTPKCLVTASILLGNAYQEPVNA